MVVSVWYGNYMFEKRWASVPPQAFTLNGKTNGEIKIASGACSLFKVKQKVIINAASLPILDQIEIKKILDDSTIVIGPIGADIHKYTDLSAYTLALGAFIYANEQHRALIPFEESTRAVYEEEPTVANRSILVDQCGDKYTVDNPFPVQLSDGSINIGAVNAELEVQLSHLDNDPDSGDVHDSIRIGDGKDQLEINDDGSINIVPGLGPGATAKSFYNEVTSVATSVITTVLTYTVPAITTAKLKTIDVSGTNIAQFQVEVNSIVVDKKRTYFSGPFNEVFNFDGSISLVAGSIIRVRVLHTRPFVGDFNARLSIIEQV